MIFGTDIAPPCGECQGTVAEYRINHGDRLVAARCSGCHARRWFALYSDGHAVASDVIADDVTARAIREAHQRAREVGALYREPPASWRTICRCHCARPNAEAMACLTCGGWV